MVRPYTNRQCQKNMKHFVATIKNILPVLLSVSCVGSPQDSPQSIADTYAQSMCDLDIEGMMSCFEYGEEAMGFMEGYYEESDVNLNNIQKVISAAKESELIPEMSYEIVEEKIEGDKGIIRIKFDFEFYDGEEFHKESKYETIPIYCHEGRWWVGEGYSKKERVIERRFMNFLDKLK